MRAVVYQHTGPSSVLQLVQRDDPSPGPGEVLVRVVRAGVNPTDWKFRAAMMSGYDEVVPGQDGAGTIEAVGSGVRHVRPGDRVWLVLAQHGRAYGAGAELTVQPAANVHPLPDRADFDLGASLGVPAVTAHRALTSSDATRRLGPGTMSGQVVLVAGGAGAVGNAAIQLAVWSGARVITTVSNEAKGRAALAAGAHHVVNYVTEDAAASIAELAQDGVDLIVEVAPAQNLGLDLEVVKNHGTIAFYANNGGDDAGLPVRPSFAKNVRIQGVLLYTLDPSMLSAAAEDVNAAVAAGALQVGEHAGLPLHHFSLAQTAEAHDAVEGGTVGKVLLDIG
ncbi:NADPH:quinone reductase [Nocardioides salsibiostraticola]